LTGRWKATPVAVKIIEHHAAGARSSDGKAISAGREAGRETLLASVSHPNVVTTYHVSTMTVSDRSALASSWLENGGLSSKQQAMQQEFDDSQRDDDSDSDGSTSSGDLDEAPDISETWVIMECMFWHHSEWCEAVKLVLMPGANCFCMLCLGSMHSVQASV
jgi:hypothetical protein